MKRCFNEVIAICTAISFQSGHHYFGRNLDLDHHYDESVVIVPRNFPISMRCADTMCRHYSLIGMATVIDNMPLFYDATNEKGLSIAALNFPGNAKYFSEVPDKTNIAPFELIPWLLGQCASVEEAEEQLQKINISEISYSDDYPLTPLHWLIADKNLSITVESTTDGLQIYRNSIGILTNNPPFPFHQTNMINYLNLTSQVPTNRFSAAIDMQPYSNGMGAIGLPGDSSSCSRFVRAAFTKLNSVCDVGIEDSISQFFHILDSVAQTRGCCETEKGFMETIYSSCCATDTGTYYYTTYENRQICAVNMYHQDLDAENLYRFPLIWKQNINHIN